MRGGGSFVIRTFSDGPRKIEAQRVGPCLRFDPLNFRLGPRFDQVGITPCQR
jgi:hypothetical protein